MTPLEQTACTLQINIIDAVQEIGKTEFFCDNERLGLNLQKSTFIPGELFFLRNCKLVNEFLTF